MTVSSNTLDFFYRKLLNIALLATSSFCASVYANPVALDGLLDLRDWSFAQQGTTTLSGEWDFYWNTLPDDLSIARVDSLNTIYKIPVPSYWNDLKINGVKLPEDGYGTYRLNILVSGNEELALKMLSIGTAYTLFIDGVELLSVGKLGRNKESSLPDYAPQIITFTPKSNRVEILIAVSNFHYRNAGLWEIIRIGRGVDLRTERESQLAGDLLLFGAILMMAIYNLCMWAARREFTFGLYLGCFCLLLGVRILLVDERYINQLIPDLGWELRVRLEFFTWFLAIPMFQSFLRNLFPREVPGLMSRALWAIGLIGSTLALTMPIKLATLLVPPYQLITLVAMGYGGWCIGIAIIRKREGSNIMGVGCGLLFIAAINDIIVNNAIYNANLTLQFGLFLFVLSQGVLVSLRFAKATRTIDLQSRELLSTTLKLTTQQKLRAAAEGKSSELTNVVDQSSKINSLAILASRVIEEGKNRRQRPSRTRAILEKLVNISGQRATDDQAQAQTNASLLFDQYRVSTALQRVTELNKNSRLRVTCDEGDNEIAYSPHTLFTLIDSLARYAVTVQTADDNISLTGHRLVTDAKFLVHNEVSEGEYFVISLEDEGHGISQKDLLEAYEAMHDANHEHCEGALSNLIVAWIIVEDTECAINVQSDHAMTRFDFYFPVIHRSPV